MNETLRLSLRKHFKSNRIFIACSFAIMLHAVQRSPIVLESLIQQQALLYPRG